jgi:hypothetical protein
MIQRICPMCFHHPVMPGPVPACEACYFAFCMTWGKSKDREKCWICQKEPHANGLLICGPCNTLEEVR